MKSQSKSAARAYSPRYSLYQKLFFLYALNLTDWLCTQALLSSGRFYEANPIMSPVLQNFFPSLLIKAILPLALTILCAVLFKLSGSVENRFGGTLLNIGIIAYSEVNLWHIFNFIVLFSLR